MRRRRVRARSQRRGLARVLTVAQPRVRGEVETRRYLARVRVLGRDKVWTPARDLYSAVARALARARYCFAKEEPEAKANRVVWQSIVSEPRVCSELLAVICHVFGLEPRAQWMEALRVGLLPTFPDRFLLTNSKHWLQTKKAVEQHKENEADIHDAAWQLLYDCWLWLYGYYESPEESLFSDLVALTRDHEAPPLRIAHCIRDVTYGDESRVDDLVGMVNSDDQAYREIFVRSCWLPTPEEAEREKKRPRSRK